VNQLQKLLICSLAALLAGCGELSYDVGRSRRYQRGGYVPGHVFRLNTEAKVIATAATPHKHELQRASMPHPQIFHIVRRVPAGSQIHINSLRRRIVIVAGFSMGDFVEVHGTILDRKNGTFTIEGDSDLSIERPTGFAPPIASPNPKYLTDITSGFADEHR